MPPLYTTQMHPAQALHLLQLAFYESTTPQAGQKTRSYFQLQRRQLLHKVRRDNRHLSGRRRVSNRNRNRNRVSSSENPTDSFAYLYYMHVPNVPMPIMPIEPYARRRSPLPAFTRHPARPVLRVVCYSLFVIRYRPASSSIVSLTSCQNTRTL